MRKRGCLINDGRTTWFTIFRYITTTLSFFTY
uniref:Uncharacterized protein n=1 Tax=Lepeophtheirus salmonis TaxID=72036 RepID=A0A0K2V3A0_LEPSM